MANGLLTGRYGKGERFDPKTDYRATMPQFTDAAMDQNRALLALLRRDGGDALSQAAAAMRAGDAEGAKAILQPILGTPEAATLLEQLNRRR